MSAVFAVVLALAVVAGTVVLGLYSARRRSLDAHWRTLPEWARRQP